MIRVAWYRFRTTFGRRWGSYLTVALLVGLVGGLAMGTIAAARRTQSAFPASLAASNASDLQFQAYFGGCQTITSCLYSPKITRELAHLPHVRHVSAYVQMFLAPIGRNGKPFLPPALANNEINTIGSVNGQYFHQDRMIADQGRVPDAANANEFAVTAQTARLLGWHVGEIIPMAAYTFSQVASSGVGLPQSTPFLRIDAKLVGLVAFNSAVVHDEVDQYPTFELFTPALTKRLISGRAAGFTVYALRLDNGAQGVNAVEHELIDIVPPSTPYNFHVTSVVESQVERAAKPESIALGAFGVIALLAALLIAAQAISRTMRRNRQDLEIQRALGATPAMTTLDSLLGVLGAIVIGAFTAGLMAVIISPFSPIGAVRQVDPSPGFNFDWTVLGAGFGLLVVVLGALAVVLAFTMVRHVGMEDRGRPVPGSFRIVSGAGRIGLPVSSIVGIRYAIERGGRGSEAVPVGSVVIGAVLAVTVVVTTLTFGSGLGTLVSHPALYGWNWSYAIQEAGGGQVPPLATGMLNHDRDVASWTGFNFGDAQIDGQTVPILISRANAPLAPRILSGHGLRANNEIVLGGTTLAQLHKHIGETVSVSYGLPKDAPAYLPPTSVRIVGTATMPAIGNPQTLHVSMGEGGLVSKEIAPAGLKAVGGNSDPNLNGPAIVVVKLRGDVTSAAGLRSLQRIAKATSTFVDNDPNSGGGTFEVLPVQQPAEIVNYKTMGATPAILASVLAVGAVVALGLTLVASVRRRRRDLALLRTIGFTRRQLASVVAWQASVAAVIGIVVGIPLGIVAGRVLWTLFAHEIYAVPDPTVPSVTIVLVALGALVLANLVAAIPGRIAASTPTAVLLRAE